MLLLPILAAAAPAGPDTSTAIFSPGIRSLAVNIEGAFLAPPVLTLGATAAS